MDNVPKSGHIWYIIYLYLCTFIYNFIIVPSAAPRNVTALSMDPSSLLVSWLPPLLIDYNGDLIGFTILYKKVGSNVVHSVQLSTNITVGEINQLIPSTKYIQNSSSLH